MSSNLYLDLMKNVLTDLHRINKGEYKPLTRWNMSGKQKMLLPLERLLRRKNFAICKFTKPDINDRISGKDWPTYADTMIGIKRLKNIQYCIEQVLQNNVEGDLIETGVWRGGGVIFMRAVLKAYDNTDKTVWVADSFEGLPKPDEEKYEHDKGDWFHTATVLAVSQEEVAYNFRKYDLLDDQVKFLKGWFKDTLPVAPIEKLSILRLDGDMYESTMDGLTHLYHKLSPGGYIIVDDYYSVNGCKMAIEDFRKAHNITDNIIEIDQDSVYWQKTKETMPVTTAEKEPASFIAAE